MLRARSLLLFAPILVLGVTGSPAGAKPSATLAKLADEYWQKHLQQSPVSATALGDHRYDDKLSDISPAGMEAERASNAAFLERAKAIDPGTLESQIG